MAARGKRWAIGAAVGAAACLGAAGYSFRSFLVERWYIWDLDSKDPSRRVAAFLALGEMRSARGALRLLERGDFLLFGDEEVSASLRSAIEDLGPEALLFIGRARRPSDPERLFYLDQMAGNILSQISPADRQAIRGLTCVLGWKDSPQVVQAAWRLKRFGPAAVSAAPALIALLQDERYMVRHHAALALAKIRPGVLEAIPVLTEALKTIPPPLEAVKALGDLGPAAKEAVPGLIEVLKAESAQTRAGAAWALGRIGRAARAAGPALESAQNDPDPETRRYARWALRRLGLEPAPAMAGGSR